MKTKPQPKSAPTTFHSLAALQARVVKKVAGRSTTERFDGMLSAGSDTKSGKLSRQCAAVD